jgi:hypothetical protein
MAEFFAMAVDDDVATAVGATEECIIGGLDAGAANDVARRVEGVAVVVGEHLLGYLADIADQVSGETVGGVEAALFVEGFQLGEFVAVGGDEGLFVGSDVLLEGNGLIFGCDLVVAEDGVDLIDGEMETSGDEGQIGVEVFDLLAEEVAGNGGVVVDEETAFTVEDFAAGGEDGDLADAVGFGEGTEAFGVEDLKTPEPDEEYGENKRDEVLDRVKLADGQLLGFAVGADVVGFGMVERFHAWSQSTTGVAKFAVPLLCIKVVRLFIRRLNPGFCSLGVLVAALGVIEQKEDG